MTAPMVTSLLIAGWAGSPRAPKKFRKAPTGKSKIFLVASSQKSLVIKIFAVGHRKIIDFPALAKNDKQLSFLQKSDAFLPQFNP